MPKIKGKEYLKQIVTCKGVPIRLSADFSKETLQSRMDWQEVFNVMKSKALQPRFLCPAKLSFRLKDRFPWLSGQTRGSHLSLSPGGLIERQILIHQVRVGVETGRRAGLRYPPSNKL